VIVLIPLPEALINDGFVDWYSPVLYSIVSIFHKYGQVALNSPGALYVQFSPLEIIFSFLKEDSSNPVTLDDDLLQ
jgi:hypothetical protein